MTLRSRIFAGYAVLAVVVIAVGLAGYRAVHKIGQEFDAAINRTQPVLEALQDIRFQAVKLLLDAGLADPGEIPGGAGAAPAALDRAVARYRDLVHRYFPGEEEEAGDIAAAVAGLQSARERLAAGTMPAGERQAAIAALKARTERLLQAIDGAMAAEHREFLAYQAEVQAEIPAQQRLIAAVSAVLSLIAILGGIHVARRLSRPLVALRDAARQIGAGRLGTRLASVDRTEIGDLARTFDAMAERLSSSMVSRAYVENIIDSLAEGCVVVDGRGRVERVNQAFRNLYGGEAGDGFQGRPLADFFPASALPTQVLESPAGPLWAEMAMDGADGRPRIVSLAIAGLQKDCGGSGAVILVQDISVRKAAEQALRNSAGVLRAIGDNLPGCAIYELVPTAPGRFRFSHVSQAIRELTGIPAAEVMADAGRLFAAIHRGDRKQVLRAIRRALARGQNLSVEVRLIHRDGTLRWMSCRASLVCRDDGPPLWHGVMEDISQRVAVQADLAAYRSHLETLVELRATQLRQLNATLEQRVRERTVELAQSNEALLRSNQDLQHFAHVAAHDLQTPLRSIVGFAQLLRRDCHGRLGERADEWITHVVDNTKRMQVLIQDLLAYSRLDAKARPFEATDLDGLVLEVKSTLAGRIEESGAEILAHGLPAVWADRTQLAQVLQNLIDNGIKYNQAKPPRVRIQAERQGADWLFSVTDNGIGIDARYHQRVFEIFRRLHTQHEYPGSGIGLAICYRIIERHGGRIWVESRAGDGSAFRFTLPAAAPAPA